MKALIEVLYDALKVLHSEQAEYIMKNSLGLPHDNQSMQQALIALTRYEEYAKKPKAAEPELPARSEARY